MSGLGWEKRYKPTVHEQDWRERFTLALFIGGTLASLIALVVR